jgi:hypothetical protein
MSSAKVFVSHASRNFRAADDLRARLEELGIPCWIAPRDIPAGSSYGEEITAAIQSAVAVVLILTEEADASRGVASELEPMPEALKAPERPASPDAHATSASRARHAFRRRGRIVGHDFQKMYLTGLIANDAHAPHPCSLAASWILKDPPLARMVNS